MGNTNKKLDLFFLVVIVLVLVGLPFGISFYDRYASSAKIPPDAKQFTLTGHAERGWLIGEIPAYEVRLFLETERTTDRKTGD